MKRGHSWITFKMISKSQNCFYFGVSSNNYAPNTCILNATIQYILATKRFDVRLSKVWDVWKIRIFKIHMLTLPSLTIVHTRFNVGYLCLFYHCRYHLYNIFSKFSFYKYISPNNKKHKKHRKTRFILLNHVAVLQL